MSLGDCSETCGGGTSMEIRACLTGDNCVGIPTRFQTCATTPCPGQWPEHSSVTFLVQMDWFAQSSLNGTKAGVFPRLSRSV